MADLVTIGSGRLREMDRSGVPENEITGLHVDLGHFTASFLEPGNVLLAEQEEIHEFQLRWWCVFMVRHASGCTEKFVEEFCRALHQDETAIILAIWSIV